MIVRDDRDRDLSLARVGNTWVATRLNKRVGRPTGWGDKVLVDEFVPAQPGPQVEGSMRLVADGHASKEAVSLFGKIAK